MGTYDSVDTSKNRTLGGKKGQSVPGLPGTGESMRKIMERGYEPADCAPYKSESSKIRAKTMPMHSRSPDSK